MPMNAPHALAAIRAQPEGPIRKFQLIKTFGPALRQAGIDPRQMSCTAIESEIEKLLPQMTH